NAVRGGRMKAGVLRDLLQAERLGMLLQRGEQLHHPLDDLDRALRLVFGSHRARDFISRYETEPAAAMIRTMRVGLLVTCLVDLVRPRIGIAAVKLLEEAGCEVVVPQAQTCCGQPGWNSGDRASARALAQKLIGEFEACEYVVAPSGSCAGMVKLHFAEIFAGEGAWLERAERLAKKTYELTDFLVTVAGIARVHGGYS